jgi:4'-phosphopantetheinyl transferase
MCPAPEWAAVQVAPRAHVAVAGIDDVLDALPVACAVDDQARSLPPWRAREYRAVRALLDHTLRSVLPSAPGSAALRRHPGGRPFLTGRPDVGVSLSHSDRAVAVAVAVDRAVGIDVQSAWVPSAGMLRRCCSPADAARLRALPPGPRARRFARVWAAQEACVKATGSGLAGRPWHIPVAPEGHAGVWRSVRWQHLRAIGSREAVCCAFTPPGPLALKEEACPLAAPPPSTV